MIADVYELCSSLIPKMITEYNQLWLCTRPHQDGTFAAQRVLRTGVFQTVFTIGCTLTCRIAIS